MAVERIRIQANHCGRSGHFVAESSGVFCRFLHYNVHPIYIEVDKLSSSPAQDTSQQLGFRSGGIRNATQPSLIKLRSVSM
jgi:hypothetical protein